MRVSVPESNPAFLTNKLGHKLTEQNALILAHFGYKDPSSYVPLQIKEKRIPVLIDFGSIETYFKKSAAKLLGTFDKSEFVMKAANSNTVIVDRIEHVTYNLRRVERTIFTRYSKSLDYNCFLGTDTLKSFDSSVDFGSGVCGLPGGGGDRGKWIFLTKP